MEIRAILIEISKEVNVSKTFRKREFIAAYAENPQYPEYLKFEMVQDKCDLLNDFEVGQEVNIYFNLKGRKWISPKGETLYFNTLQAWKILSSDVIHAAASGGDHENPSLDAYENDEIPF